MRKDEMRCDEMKWIHVIDIGKDRADFSMIFLNRFFSLSISRFFFLQPNDLMFDSMTEHDEHGAKTSTAAQSK